MEAEAAGIVNYAGDYPFQQRSVAIDGHRIAYLDTGQGEQTLLMIHGNPVAGYVYDKMVRNLQGQFRCVVPDLLGFGFSDKPPSETDYSLLKHTDIVEQFVERLNLKDVVLIVHDWGGPIGLGAAIRHQRRYSHLVILNTMSEAPVSIRPLYWLPFHILLRLRRFSAYLVKERNLFQRMGVAIMAREDQEVYFQANNSPETRAGIAAFPRMIPYKRSHQNYPVLKELLESLRTWDIPALVIFSDKDSVFTAEQGRRFASDLRNGRFVLIPGVKHFLQYQRPQEVAAEIRNFIGQGN